ncbi:unnamed protein product [Clavelina lepadiformis]|uniref:Uncharacterized protein n=1 Tax=Clavelina lepadiformis TaxID=159417 RepID=A0ABP0F541_CLALP
MPEQDKLAKLIAHRQKQEKKNDRLRVHKNKLEIDRLKLQISHLDWNKKIRNHEFVSLETDYMRRLEKIYDRQLRIEDRRIKDEGQRRLEKEARKLRLENSEMNATSETDTSERRKQLHGFKQGRAKSFMSKVRTLSGGYRDNDPPQSYYKRNGLVPPERMVDPETSANAQANYGGGWRRPASADHLIRSKLPKETLYGIKEPPSNRRINSNTRSRTSSATSKSELCSQLLLSDDDQDDNDVLIDEVMGVNVRPSTAPGIRNSEENQTALETRRSDSVMVTHTENTQLYGQMQGTGIEPEVMNVEVKAPNDSKVRKTPRPASVAVAVHFNGNVNERETSPTRGRRRGSMLRAPNALMFRRKSNVGLSPPSNGTVSAPTSPRRQNSGGVAQEMMSNIEQERIRRKMHEKAQCLARERTHRMLLASMANDEQRKPSNFRSHSARRARDFSQYARNRYNFAKYTPVQTPRSTSEPDKQIEVMLNYIDRCDRGLIIPDNDEAKKVLLQATRERLIKLKGTVAEFVSA